MLLAAVFLPVSGALAQIQPYQTLVSDLPGIGKTVSAGDFSGYLNAAFKIGIIVAILLAVVMLVIAGIEYMGSDSFFSKESAKKKIYDAIGGLILALGIFLFLNTVNPDLVKLNLNIQHTAPAAKNIPETASGKYDKLPTVPTCYEDCVVIPGQYGVPTKTPGACSGSGPCKVKSNLANNLMLLNKSLDQKNIGWQVTEAWPPTGYSESRPNGIHKSSCHGDGSCVDANFFQNTPATTENINKFCDSAKLYLGSVAYEVRTNADAADLKGKISCTVWVTGNTPHFHMPIVSNSSSGNYTNSTGATED